MKYYPLPTTRIQPETVILADGSYPTHPIPLSMIQNSERIICCDGATEQLLKFSTRFPDVIAGDCDSLSDENKIRFSSIIHQVKDQETNDLTKAVQYAVNNGFSNIVIVGATGRREDHSLGNISLLAEYIDFSGINIQLITDYGVFTAIKENSRFESFAGQQVSIFSIDHQPITSHGLMYPIENRIFTNWWQGTLNESVSDSFKLETNGKIIIFRAYD